MSFANDTYLLTTTDKIGLKQKKYSKIEPISAAIRKLDDNAVVGTILSAPGTSPNGNDGKPVTSGKTITVIINEDLPAITDPKEREILIHNLYYILDAYQSVATDKDITNTTKIEGTYYEKNIQLQNKLDQQMLEIYKTDNSVYASKQKQMDSTVYANLLWTVLATSILYYTFMKI